MKLATLRDGSRDGLLAVVSNDLSLAHVAQGRARTLQHVLDDWDFLSPQLEDLSNTLNLGKARHAFSFDPRQCMAPLPRAFCWAMAAGEDAVLKFGSGSSFGGPTDPVQLPPSALVVTQQAGDRADLAPADDPSAAEALPAHQPPSLQAQAGLAVLTGDIAAATAADATLEGVRLLLLALHWRTAAGPAWHHTAWAPLAVTPEALGSAWQKGRVHAALQLQLNRTAGPSRHPNTRQQLPAEQVLHGQAHGFAALLARLAADGPVAAGSLVGSGPLGTALPGLQVGDELQLECTGADGLSVFGAVQQGVAGEG